MNASKSKAWDLARHIDMVAARLKMAAKSGLFNGRPTAAANRYLNRCRRVDDMTGTVVIFTRDAGHHTSGWMRNPDYEFCRHLSLSPAPTRILIPGAQRVELDAKTKRAWLRAFFGDSARLTWEESAKSPEGIARSVVHYRLFCDETWTPILPRGEVYSSELTELGWRSASQVLEEDGTEILSTMDPT